MKLALIPPISLLECTDETDMQLMLPQLIKNDAYRYVYSRHCDDPRQYVILDNGAAEGESTSTGALLRTAHNFGVDEVVIPDVMMDQKGTLDEYQKFWSYARESTTLMTMKTMFVLQGSNADEFYELADVATTPRFRANVIGIPRHSLTTCNDPLIRFKLAQYIKQERGSSKEIHLLGGSPEFPSELKRFRRTDWVRSTDTSSAFNYAYAGELLHMDYAPIRRPADYFDQPYTAFNVEMLEENIKKLKSWTSEAV